MTNKTAIIIPARLVSSRLPRKLLLDRTGKPLIQHTFEAVKAINGVDLVAVATSDREIKDVVERFGGTVIFTDQGITTGTERVRCAARSLPADFSRIINVQGDEPEIGTDAIESIISALGRGLAIATICAPITDKNEFERPSVVKVVVDYNSYALYFSRAPIPYRHIEPCESHDVMFGLRHVGVYGFQRNVLDKLTVGGTISVLDRQEGLEQLRWLELGHEIWVGLIKCAHPGIDTESDYVAFCGRFVSRGAHQIVET